jgi:hypothetical protein
VFFEINETRLFCLKSQSSHYLNIISANYGLYKIGVRILNLYLGVTQLTLKKLTIKNKKSVLMYSSYLVENFFLVILGLRIFFYEKFSKKSILRSIFRDFTDSM